MTYLLAAAHELDRVFPVKSMGERTEMNAAQVQERG